jgi:hypothetical protein
MSKEMADEAEYGMERKGKEKKKTKTTKISYPMQANTAAFHPLIALRCHLLS